MMSSLCIQTEKPLELVIVDSSDQPIERDPLFVVARQACEQAHINVRYQHVLVRGAAHQRNVGIALCRGDVIHFLDDDVVLELDYCQRMHEVFVAFPDYVGGMGTVTSPKTNWCVSRLIRCIFLLQRENADGKFTFSGMPTHAYGRRVFLSVTVLGGCCMCLRADIVRQFLFDEFLGAYSYMEDADISKRISGEYKLFYNPLAVLDHRQSPQNRDALRKNRALYVRNYTYLFFKNFYPHNKLKIIGYWWSILGLLAEAIVGRNKLAILGYWDGLSDAWYRKDI